ncbi:glycosyltransferase family 1 protein [Corynebacterium suedekumii]|nr:glycosyltransferase family 1 protein [Corynebacterium suedekumii]
MHADRAATPATTATPATQAVPETPRITVLSIPADHVYPAAVRPERVDYLPDPDIDGNWWPHPALEAQWWADPDNGRDVDVVHLHFGFDHLSVEETVEFTRALERRGVPLVVTVHDLDNPHLVEQAEHHEKRPRPRRGRCARDHPHRRGASTACRRRVPHRRHPPPAGGAGRPDPRPDGRIVGVFLKSLRGNVVADADFYRTLAGTLAEHVDGTVRVHLHDVEQTRPLIVALQDTAIDLRVHDPLPDDELHAAVAECTTVVLPYIRGTHSGWLEMCRDLGVTVAVPDCGCYLSQADDPAAVVSYRTGDAVDAAAAVTRLLESGRVPYRGDRDAQLVQIRAAHAAVYEEVTSR